MRSAALAILALGLLSPTPSLAAQDAFEPNDFIVNAAGPLLAGGSYQGALESQVDKDLFYFHMNSPRSSQAELRVTNLGGSGVTSDLSLTVLDSSGTPLAGTTYIRAGGPQSLFVTLEPQKYYVEVATGEGFGDTYTLQSTGAPGAFGPYAQILGRCDATTKAASGADMRLGRAEGRLQRTLARLRRSRYQGPAARKSARRAYRRTRAVTNARRRSATGSGRKAVKKP